MCSGERGVERTRNESQPHTCFLRALSVDNSLSFLLFARAMRSMAESPDAAALDSC
jgi:hypothetical protein